MFWDYLYNYITHYKIILLDKNRYREYDGSRIGRERAILNRRHQHKLNAWVDHEVYQAAMEKARAKDLTLSQIIRRCLRQYVGQADETAAQQDSVPEEQQTDPVSES